MPTPMPIVVPIIVPSSDNGAKKIACEGYLKDYDAKTATVQQMQTYADCVKLLTPADAAGMKIIVACLLIAALLGIIYGLISDEFSGDRIFGVMLGAIGGLLVAATVGLIGVAIGFVLS